MIDIHSHILPFVDDGSQEINSSIKMIKDSINQGVTDIILTPHYRMNYKLTPQQINLEFDKFKKIVADEGLKINLFLGQEIYIDDNYKQYFVDGNLITLNKSRYVLIEYNFIKKVDYVEIAYEIIRLGYIPVIAHFERYLGTDLFIAVEIKNMGGFIQVNAESIVGKQRRAFYKKVKQLFKNDLVDFVASDVHDYRDNHLFKAYKFVEKKFGTDVAKKTFIDNAKKILEG